MRHEDVYYTCDNCGKRLSGDHTVVVVTNTDPAAVEPTHEYHLCATAWLAVRPILDKQRIDSASHDEEVQRAMRPDADRLYDPYDRI